MNSVHLDPHKLAARVICAYLKRAYEAAGLKWNYMNEGEITHALLTLATPPNLNRQQSQDWRRRKKMIYQGYTKFQHPATGAKYYRANIANGHGAARYTRRKFSKAAQAQIYGYRLAMRYRRMTEGVGA